MKRRTLKKKQVKKQTEEAYTGEFDKSLDENLNNLKKMLDEPDDLVVRELSLGENKQRYALVNIDGLVDKQLVHTDIVKNLQILAKKNELPEDVSKLVDELKNNIISVTEIEKAQLWDDMTIALLSGSTVLFIDGVVEVLIMPTPGWETRSIDEPESESLIRGPRDGFIENLQTNLMLIRRQINDPNLRFKSHRIGRRAKKKLVVTYMEGIVNPKLLKEVNRRLETIDTDSALESGTIEHWIQDSFLTPFPVTDSTERPDKVASAILYGKIAILLDGTPYVLVLPTTLGNLLQSPEDYYERWQIGTLLRILRYFAAFIALFAPSLYIALISYHQGMIPSDLAFSIAATRQGVPFPAFIEALLMAVTMELLREAGARLPQTIGQTIGIVGGLVIGEAAVTAGMVSPVMVIVVAITAIASFSFPSYSTAIAFRMLRFGFMFAAAFLGLYGIVLVYIMVNIHIVNLKSLGVPYSSPFAPGFLRDWKDLILRVPDPLLSTRRGHLLTKDKRSADKGGPTS
ncbi:spore germination protein [Virgibacillus kimchii]